MKGNRVLWIGGIFLAAWILFFAWFEAAAGRGRFTQQTPPLIVEIQPPANSHSAPVTTALTVTYDQPIDPATVGLATFPIHGQYSGRLAGSYSVGGVQAVFQPAGSLWPGDLVQATVTTGTLNPAGQWLLQPLVWQFRMAVDWGTGLFTDTGQQLGTTASFSGRLGDLDGDGDLDVFLAKGLGNQPNEVWLNDGHGYFTDSGQRLGNSDSRGLALGDLDGDGDLDAVVANWNGQYNRVWFNDGLGLFLAGQQFDNRDGTGVALGDLDGDGDLDIFSVNGSNQTDTVWFNNGSGGLVNSGQLIDSDAGRQAFLADLDGDGDLDAFVANRGPNRVFFNNGRGHFADSGQALGNHRSTGLDMADVDGDGDLDAFIANAYDPPPSQVYNRLWINNGHGQFTDSGQLMGHVGSTSVALGDIDSDGDLDALVTNGPDHVDELWMNDGAGNFSNTGQAISAVGGLGVSLGDLDGDGDLDAWWANNEADQVWLNFSSPVSGLLVAGGGPTPLGLATHLTATISGGTEVSYIWDLGDGTSATGPVVSHVYQEPGAYTTVVTASNNLNSQSASTEVVVFQEGDIYLPLALRPLD